MDENSNLILHLIFLRDESIDKDFSSEKKDPLFILSEVFLLTSLIYFLRSISLI